MFTESIPGSLTTFNVFVSTVSVGKLMKWKLMKNLLVKAESDKTVYTTVYTHRHTHHSQLNLLFQKGRSSPLHCRIQYPTHSAVLDWTFQQTKQVIHILHAHFKSSHSCMVVLHSEHTQHVCFQRAAIYREPPLSLRHSLRESANRIAPFCP